MSALDAYETCDRCGGTGFAPFIPAWRLYQLCKPCGGTGQRLKTSRRIWRLIRHGLADQGDDY